MTTLTERAKAYAGPYNKAEAADCNEHHATVAAYIAGYKAAVGDAAAKCVDMNETNPLFGAHLQCADAIRALIPSEAAK